MLSMSESALFLPSMQSMRTLNQRGNIACHALTWGQAEDLDRDVYTTELWQDHLDFNLTLTLLTIEHVMQAEDLDTLATLTKHGKILDSEQTF